MKKILFSMLALTVLAGCTKSESGSEGDNAMPVPICLGAGVEMPVKAPVTTGPITAGNEINAGIAGWENTLAETYAAAPLWSTDITTTANATTGQSVAWTTQKYYNADNGIKTYLKAWYPKGTLTGTAVSFSNTAGDKDPLLTPAINGSKDAAANKVLAFVHKTTQLKFKVIAGVGLASGTKIKRITLKSVQLPTGFDLTKEASVDGAVTYAVAADLIVPNLTEAVIGSTAAVAGDAVMIKPWRDNSLKIEVQTSNATYTAKTFTTSDSKLSEGSAYEVTLTFGQKEVGLKATIAEWTAATGSGEIE